MKLLTLLLALISAEAFANACKQDAERLCGGIDPGKNQIFLCLQNYESQLTSACKQEMRAFKQKTQAKNPCFSDLADFCSDIDPRNAHYCLMKNESRLSASCAADYGKHKGQIIVKNPCAMDIVNNCYKEVSGPEGSINKCLIKNQGKLSKFCQNNVTAIVARAKKNNPCFDDQEKFCPTQVKFMDIHECLTKKLTAITPACKAVVTKEEEKARSNPCYKDLKRHCVDGLSPNQQVQCLTLNDKQISSSCRQYRAVMDDKVKKMVNACEADRVRLCSKAPAKDGMVLKCLREKKAQVSPACKNLI